MNNILFCSVGRRVRLLKDFRNALQGNGKVIACDVSPVAPALYVADESFTVPRIDSPDYFDKILEICDKCHVDAITPLIDPEIEVHSKHRDELQKRGILPLCPAQWTAQLCYNKFEMYKHLKSVGIRTMLTYNTLASFSGGLRRGEIQFPVFIKPVNGSGSEGIAIVSDWHETVMKFNDQKYSYIIQELMVGGDCDADVYVDCISHKPISIFPKRKIESRIGGANKTISFRDEKLFKFIEDVCSVLELNGPCDMDFFYRDGEYYLSEINPRFGGAYLHAHRSGANFIDLILNNINGIENEQKIGDYQEDTVMMMYDDVIVTKKSDLLGDDFPLL